MTITVGGRYVLAMSQEDLEAVGAQDRAAYEAHQNQQVTAVSHWPAIIETGYDAWLVRADDGWEDMVYADELKEIEHAQG